MKIFSATALQNVIIGDRLLTPGDRVLFTEPVGRFSGSFFRGNPLMHNEFKIFDATTKVLISCEAGSFEEALGNERFEITS